MPNFFKNMSPRFISRISTASINFIFVLATPAFATSPSTEAFVFVSGGLILGLLLPFILYPILVSADSAKLWMIAAVGAISLLWSGLMCAFLDGSIAAIYFVISAIMFAVSYLKKESKIEKLKESSTKKYEEEKNAEPPFGA